MVWGQESYEGPQGPEIPKAIGRGGCEKRCWEPVSKWRQRTHNEGTSGAEGKGPTGVEVGGVERDQDTDEVETLCLGGSRETKLPSLSPQTPSRGLRGCSPMGSPAWAEVAHDGLRSRLL